VSLTAIGVIGIAVLLTLMLLRVPIAFAMGITGLAGLMYVSGVGPGLAQLRLAPYTVASSYTLSVIPLFILMGQFAYHSELSRELYAAAYKWLGRLPGSLAMATVASCAAFGAVCGSSPATAATMGIVAIPEMRRYNYDPALACGATAAGGGLGILIPPSVVLILYGLMAEESIGALFMAGILPGIALAVLWMLTIYFMSVRNPKFGPRGPASSFREKLLSLKGVWGMVVLFAVVLGGIYMGLFTPTEAGAAGAFGAFLFALSRRKMKWQAFKSSLLETGSMTAMIFLILIGATIFGYFLAVTRIPMSMATFLAELEVSRYIIFAGVFLVYLLLGCLMSSLAMIILTVPIFYPTVTALGFDPIWFGIIIVLAVELGVITPPVGINVYVIKGVAKDVPITTIFRGTIPFVITGILFVVILTVFPQMATFLPSLMK